MLFRSVFAELEKNSSEQREVLKKRGKTAVQKKEQEKKAIKDRQEERAALTEGGEIYTNEKRGMMGKRILRNTLKTENKSDT